MTSTANTTSSTTLLAGLDQTRIDAFYAWFNHGVALAEAGKNPDVAYTDLGKAFMIAQMDFEGAAPNFHPAKNLALDLPAEKIFKFQYNPTFCSLTQIALWVKSNHTELKEKAERMLSMHIVRASGKRMGR